MADKITQTSELKLDFAFYDGDNRVVTLDNPRSDITVAELLAVGASAKTTKALIGDKASADCVGIQGAKKVAKKTTQLDLR